MPQGKGIACILLHWRVCEHNSESLLDAKEKLAWTLQLQAAERRTPIVTSLYRDKWTAVAKSTVAGRGLFAMRKIPAGFALYVYTGVKRTSQDADRYPNAYQLELNDGSFCDAGDASHSSPARWVNTRDRDLKLPRIDQVSESAQNNCEYEEYNGKLYLVTTCSIKPFQELFASYGQANEGFPEWPQGFLGDGRVLVTKYREYLMSPPEDADSDEEDQAKQLQAWLQTDLDKAQDKLGHGHTHPSSPCTQAANLSS